ncbi:MAG TPA: endonuclease/exonuclease/phosphatase family protein, partial [Chitinophagales bacterium]|nr:endonuclease/exonuclease/phosphatase family protein [Chitinophagales bacterium]
FGAGRNNGKHAGEHSAIFYKSDKYEQVEGGNFWLSQTPGVPGSKSWDAAITRICTWVKLKDKETGKELLVFNTHFDHRGKVARRNSAALLRMFVDSLAGNLPVIVTGDFNFGPDDAAYTIMSRVGEDKVQLSDSYTQGALPYTDCGFEVSNTNCHRIDYIWYSPHFSKSNYLVHTDNNGTYYPSDHLPVSVLLKAE